MKIKNASPETIEYHALRGSFGRVTYFVTKAGLRDVAENLDLAPQQELSFSERIQRIINEVRVREEILPYLRQNELRFFNALVCILLPDADSSQPFWDFVEYRDEDDKPLGGLGKLRIAKKVGRVVLDGQHRFRALRLLWDEVKGDPGCPDASLEIALIFVMVDDLGRFNTDQSDLRTKTISAVRNLFAVLNKTARRVDKTTLLLIDDTDIANVMTRALLEEERIPERLVKWTGSENLQPTDVYFTPIHVIKDAVCFYLRDFPDEVKRDYGNDADRADALSNLYEATPQVEVPLREAIPEIIKGVSSYASWEALLKKHKIDVPYQPALVELSGSQPKVLKAEREQQLAYTVAGQKALYRAIIEAFYGQRRRHMPALRAVISRANKVLEKNLFTRHPSDANPFLKVLFDSKNRMSWAEGPVDLARRILGHALGSGSVETAILDDYQEFTENDSSIVEKFWKKVAAATKS